MPNTPHHLAVNVIAHTHERYTLVVVYEEQEPAKELRIPLASFVLAKSKPRSWSLIITRNAWLGDNFGKIVGVPNDTRMSRTWFALREDPSWYSCHKLLQNANMASSIGTQIFLVLNTSHTEYWGCANGRTSTSQSNKCIQCVCDSTSWLILIIDKLEVMIFMGYRKRITQTNVYAMKAWWKWLGLPRQYKQLRKQNGNDTCIECVCDSSSWLILIKTNSKSFMFSWGTEKYIA